MTYSNHHAPAIEAFKKLSERQKTERLKVFEILANKKLSREDSHELLFTTASFGNEGFERVLKAVILDNALEKQVQTGLFV